MERGRKTRFKHQRSAAKLLGSGSRTGLCMWAAASNAYGVDVIHNATEKKSRFNGLQTCGSVWNCPCCSAQISQTRRSELNQLLAWARSKGHTLLMLTLTTRHDRTQSLKGLLDGLKEAKRRFQQHSAFKRFKARIVGSVTATEVNGGGVNGWHPHFHIIYIVEGAHDTAIESLESLRPSWLTCLNASGLSGGRAAFDVQNANAAGNYITKWGVGEELALNNKKKGRGDGRNPFQLLADYSDLGDLRAGELFKEYAQVFRGRNQLNWSHGLKDLANIKVQTDEEAAELKELSEADKLVFHFGTKQWAKVREHRAAILKMSEVAGEAGIYALLKIIRERAAAKPPPQNMPYPVYFGCDWPPFA